MMDSTFGASIFWFRFFLFRNRWTRPRSSLNLFFLSLSPLSPHPPTHKNKQVVLSIVYIVALSRAGALDLNGGNKKDKDKVDKDEDEEAAAAAGDGDDMKTTRSRSSPPPFRFSRATARAVAPMALLWFGYVASGVAALRYLNVPMYSVLRRATTPLVALGEFLAFHKKPSAPRAAALAAMLMGALLASATDLTFSLPGYLWAGVCVACTAAYLVLIRATGDSTGLGPFALQLYNNALAVPLVAAWLLASRVEVFRTVPVGVGAGGREMIGGGGGSSGGGGFSLWSLFGLGRRRASADPLDPTAILPTATAAVTSVSHVSELAAALSSPLLRDPRFVAFLVLSASQAFLLNAAIFWCTTANSPLATSVTGQLKDAATTAAGLVLFGDVAFGFGNLAGVALSLAGGIGYAAVAHAEGKREQQAGRQREQQQQQRRRKAAAAAAAAVSQDRI